MTNHRYLKNVITISFLLGCLFGTFNYFVNPFNIFNLESIVGFNEVKPEASKRVRVFKKYQPMYTNPSVLIVGNSRVEMGLDPSHENFNGQSTYNLGIPGIGIRSQLQYAQHVIEHSNIKQVLISVDFNDFLMAHNSKFKQYSLSINPITDKYGALWSLDSLKASISTLFKQNPLASNRLKNGFNPAQDYRPIIKFEGQDVLFRQKNEMLDKMFKNRVWNENLMLASEHSDLSQLQKSINLWLTNDIEVNLFINPYHRDYYTAMAENDLLDSFNSWRLLMKSIFFNKVDFCDFTGLGHEKSDEKLSDNELKYFWEPAHYKKELGDIMIPSILNGCAE